MASILLFDRVSCGLRTCIQTSNEAKLLSVSVWINAGSSRDPADKGGLAHLCEHLLLRPLAFNASRAQRIPLTTGTLVNASTDPEWVVISAQAPVEESGSLIDGLAALVRDPYCEPDGIEAEKKTIQQELRHKQPGSAQCLARDFREAAFANHRCIQPVGGTPATLGALQTEDVQRYYARSLNAPNIVITAHGDIDVGALSTMLDKAFRDFPGTFTSSGSPESDSVTAPQVAPEYRPVTIRTDMSDTDPVSSYELLAGFGSVPRTSEEYWTALAFEVLMADGPGCLISQWLRNEPQCIYGAVSMTEAFSNWGSQYFLMDIYHGRVEQVIEILGRQWRALPEFVTEKRVEALKNRFASRALSSLSDMQERMTLMRDVVLSETRRSGALEGGLEAVVTRHTRQLSATKLLSYIRQYAEWDRVSLVCAPVQ